MLHATRRQAPPCVLMNPHGLVDLGLIFARRSYSVSGSRRETLGLKRCLTVSPCSLPAETHNRLRLNPITRLSATPKAETWLHCTRDLQRHSQAHTPHVLQESGVDEARSDD